METSTLKRQPKLNVFSETLSDAELTTHVIAVLRPREIQVLVLVGQGYVSKRIAEMLNISQRTVDSHRHHLCRRLGIYTAAAQVVLGWRIRRAAPRVVARGIDNVDNRVDN